MASTVGDLPKNPGAYPVSARTQGILLVFLAIGAATFLYALQQDPARAWSGFLHNHFFFLSLAVGGLFFAAIQWITGAMWSAPVRRLAEAMTAYLPIGLGAFILLLFGTSDLYPWTHMDHVKGDLVLEGKMGYLNIPFFAIRNIFAILVWMFFAYKLIGNSIRQDKDPSQKYTDMNRKWVPVFLMLFALTYTATSFDLLMSLDPHWFSTIFGVYCFAGLFYSTLASIVVLSLYFQAKGPLKEFVKTDHLHDLGKFMFAFTVFWAYIAFSQFMLIWYANLPEETGYMIRRTEPAWMGLTHFLIFGKFFFPFFALMSRHAKRSPRLLGFIACYMLFAQWMDLAWLIQPEFQKDGPVIGVYEMGQLLGFLGAFGLALTQFVKRVNLVAIGDPRLPEALHHHQ